ncbi:uncharacterized protein LOC130636599 [Hydractinia symbiolongicarpus]|uniref:uncharacterized protein LOC130636599 n=1 Tax=Hydractinia symbiolongicarpus TaxID=13093 RepID=UPI00254C41B0|nr:uncharacterized protein LOC130636599 [Hydractinia symbiolongicarpus]
MAASTAVFLLLSIFISPVLCEGDGLSNETIYIIVGCVVGLIVLCCVACVCCKCSENNSYRGDFQLSPHVSIYENKKESPKPTISNHVAIELDQSDGPKYQFIGGYPHVQHGSFVQHSGFVQHGSFQKYLNSGTFSRGIDWQHIKQEHCSGNAAIKGQFFTSSKDDLLSYFRRGAKNYRSIKDSRFNTIVVEADFNQSIGYEIENGRRIQLYRLLMVFESNFYLKTAYPIKK